MFFLEESFHLFITLTYKGHLPHAPFLSPKQTCSEHLHHLLPWPNDTVNLTAQKKINRATVLVLVLHNIAVKIYMTLSRLHNVI